MKKHQNIFFAVLVILFSVYVVWDYYRTEKDKTVKSEKSLLLPLKADQVKEIEIIKPDSKIKIERTHFGWELTEPIRDWADNDFIEDFVAAATADKELSEIQSRDDVQFGLNRPMAQFIFTDNQGHKKTLQLSEKKNFEGSHYARKDQDERIILITNVWATRANKSLTDYRDRRLLRSKIAGVQSVSIRHLKDQFVLKSDQGRWVSPTRESWILDQNLVRQLLQSLVEAKAVEFIQHSDLKGSDFKKYGLQPPEMSVDLAFADKKWSGQLSSIKDKKRYFYVQGEQPMLYQVEEAVLARLNTVLLKDLRDAKVFFQFEKKDVTQIKYSGLLKKWSLRKTNDQWQYFDQGERGQTGKTKASQLIESLLFTQVGQFINQKVKSLALNHQLQLLNSQGEVVWWIKWSDEVEPHLIDQNKKFRLAQTSFSSEVFALDEANLQAWGIEEIVEAEEKK